MELSQPWGTVTSQIALRLASQFCPWEYLKTTRRCIVNLPGDSPMRLRLQHVHILVIKLDTPSETSRCTGKMHECYQAFLGKVITSSKFTFLTLNSSTRICFVHKPLQWPSVISQHDWYLSVKFSCVESACKVLTRSKFQCRQSCRIIEYFDLIADFL